MITQEDKLILQEQMTIHFPVSLFKALAADDMSPASSIIYMFLYHYANLAKKDDFSCEKAVSTIINDTGISKSTVHRHITTLSKKGWIERDRGTALPVTDVDGKNCVREKVAKTTLSIPEQFKETVLSTRKIKKKRKNSEKEFGKTAKPVTKLQKPDLQTASKTKVNEQSSSSNTTDKQAQPRQTNVTEIDERKEEETKQIIELAKNRQDPALLELIDKKSISANEFDLIHPQIKESFKDEQRRKCLFTENYLDSINPADADTIQLIESEVRYNYPFLNDTEHQEIFKTVTWMYEKRFDSTIISPLEQVQSIIEKFTCSKTLESYIQERPEHFDSLPKSLIERIKLAQSCTLSKAA